MESFTTPSKKKVGSRLLPMCCTGGQPHCPRAQFGAKTKRGDGGIDKQQKQRLELLEKENRSLKKSIYDISLR